MSKMKHLLRKLHIGGGFNDHNHRLAATDTPSQPPATTQFHSSSSPSPLPTVDSLAVVDNNDSSAVDFNFFEEEFQMQLALAISVSSGSAEAREPDAETAQIKAAKQRSLGCSPSESLIEFLSLRYWSNNVVNYDEKVMDGFYDVYGITSNSVTQGKMPSLVDLQAKTVYDNVDFEVILVDRTIDKELQLLEERVSNISLECHASGTSQIISRVIQRIANIVVAQMGGPVSDADEMLRRWTTRSYELRNTHKTIILPLGCIDCGLSRHRALLFKVLADKINLACSLVKGSYYTGTDDGAVNLIKIDNGSEYIIDLMGAPGTLIPVEVPCCNLQSIELDIRRDAAGSQLNSRGGNAVERNQTERFESDFGKLLPALGRSHEGLSGGGGRTSPAQKLQLNDVSKCVINAAKNPEFAQKLHAVLSKSGGTSSDSLFDVNNDEVGETEVCKTVHLLDTDMLNVGAQHGPPLVMSNYEQDLISFTAAEVNNVDDNSQLGVNWLPAKQQQLMSNKNNLGYTLPSQSTSAGFVHGHGSTGEDAMNDHAVVNSIERQYGDGVAGGGPCLINEARADNTRKGKHSDMKLVETSRIGHYTSCSNQREGISLDEVEWEIPWEDLQIGGRIGIGSYGEVYRSEWNGTEVAVKKFMNQDISGDALTQFKGEVEIMLRLRHPNVVLFMGAVTHPPNLSILTEFLPRGSLFKLLHRSNVQLDEKRRMRMALDVAKGMNYLHTSNPIIVHRDLKTPNLLVDKNWVVKVCDFGMSRMKHNTFLSSKSTAGTPEWMAPEVLRNEPSNEKCDVYSFGVILWELATLRIPWTEMNSMQVVGAVGFQFRHLDIPEHLDPVVARIISDCWHPEPQLRPSFKEIIARLKSLGHLSTDRIKTRTSE
ncbi:serine/threonine-protein kinase EDR1-like isoform X3 [Cynara cardunculus var. scolymus]|uniref:serine/threonine-protein kinase EDR1-like isoform X3 n=1 Tax=Cynara cardunculus var. scolymus TaxID=59895 RepID=UPI000D62E6EB|nr:serine/threonine-protein kinase EDR1-like isoform X3 [Cynara cardunculus var. scolymus]